MRIMAQLRRRGWNEEWRPFEWLFPFVGVDFRCRVIWRHNLAATALVLRTRPPVPASSRQTFTHAQGGARTHENDLRNILSTQHSTLRMAPSRTLMFAPPVTTAGQPYRFPVRRRAFIVRYRDTPCHYGPYYPNRRPFSMPTSSGHAGSRITASEGTTAVPVPRAPIPISTVTSPQHEHDHEYDHQHAEQTGPDISRPCKENSESIEAVYWPIFALPAVASTFTYVLSSDRATPPDHCQANGARIPFSPFSPMITSSGERQGARVVSSVEMKKRC
ncbi:hypothetical protein D9619_010185 [Psilocybe cf. subviscida]|uniref:Uncharacterized protein n=1 Tax=Psilocybe cf. subviscida TaxID=2480587 RepID=A0A8H5ASK4_9AGAR|nr:hypothetical protein D9619_010185 [Psilocybe cf. subviscida]